MAKATKNNLGRGLSALLGDDSDDYAKLEKKHGNKIQNRLPTPAKGR